MMRAVKLQRLMQPLQLSSNRQIGVVTKTVRCHWRPTPAQKHISQDLSTQDPMKPP
jgi:hypothetical protein